MPDFSGSRGSVSIFLEDRDGKDTAGTGSIPAVRVNPSLAFHATGWVVTESLREASDFSRRFLSQYVSIQGWIPDYSVYRETSPQAREAGYLLLARRIESWLRDDSGYDETVWPLLEGELEDGVRFREEED